MLLNVVKEIDRECYKHTNFYINCDLIKLKENLCLRSIRMKYVSIGGAETYRNWKCIKHQVKQEQFSVPILQRFLYENAGKPCILLGRQRTSVLETFKR